MTMLEERRRQRSDDPLVALHYQLANVRQEGQLDAIVVADDSGVVVAGAGASAVCEELAAYAPLLAQGVWSEPGLDAESLMGALRTNVDVEAVNVDGQSVLLCARGGRGTSGASQRRGRDLMRRAAQGVARILK